MSLRRVSSRPRLISDADRAFINATIIEENYRDLDSSRYDESGYHISGLQEYSGGGYELNSVDVHQDYTTCGTLSSAAVVVTDSFSSSNLSNTKSNESLSSDYMSCQDVSEANNMTRRPSLADLFHKQASLSRDEGDETTKTSHLILDENLFVDDGFKSDDAIATVSTSTSNNTKRKRNTSDQWLYHPLSISAPRQCASAVASTSTTTSHPLSIRPSYPQPSTTYQPVKEKLVFASSSILQKLPSENLVDVASYLSLQEVRALSSACHSIRTTLMNGQGANTNIWMRVIRNAFPNVFSQITNGRDGQRNAEGKAFTEQLDHVASMKNEVSSNDVTFVDDYNLPIPGLPQDEADCNITTTSNNKVNLPLLACLLPKSYPQRIDPKTFYTKKLGRNPNVNRGMLSIFKLPTFSTFALKINGEKNVVATPASHDDYDGSAEEDRLKSSDTSQEVVVPVVLFTGTVGTGDRCIRSDQPFPPTCKKVRSCGCINSTSSDSDYHHSVSFGNFSSWMKNHTVTPKRKRDRSSSHRSSSGLTDSGHDATAHGPFTPVVIHIPPTAGAPTLPSRQSPLYRFVSSLSRHCSSTTSSIVDDSFHSSSYLDTESTTSDERAIDASLNNYGMIVKPAGLVNKCKQCFRKTRDCTKTKDNLRPFVIPTVISDTREEDGGEGLVVDVTPKLVAYYEVTLIDKQDHHEWSESMTERRNRPGRIMERPADQHPNGGQASTQRHECAAIGLSTKSFSSSNKMPGWDDTSFGYHGDDGGIYHGQGDMLRRYGPAFGPGDTVGCGLEYSSRRIFFCKNGVFLGYAFDKCEKEVVDSGLYPTIGVDTECPIFVNFGSRPFKFDLRRMSVATSLD